MQGYNFIVLSTTPNLNPVPVSEESPLTPLCAALQAHASPPTSRVFCGLRTAGAFGDTPGEIDALLSSAGVCDLGWRGKILITGRDRIRWLHGMVTNTVKALPENAGNYNFVLNTQGRIQGDCTIYRRADDLILDTSRDQIPALLGHLSHYIIMDDVKLADVSERWTAFALDGPKARNILAGLGAAPASQSSSAGSARLGTARIREIEVTIVERFETLGTRYELWLPPTEVFAIWEALEAAGATPAGLEAAEILRVIEGRPLFGVDLTNRDLPQETSQFHALNFTKGCYMGQEIVERIRSRGKVHRQFRKFSLEGAATPPPFDLRSGGQTAGRITSAASLSSPGQSGSFGLGFIRDEFLASGAPIEYDGGTAIPLEVPSPIPAG